MKAFKQILLFTAILLSGACSLNRRSIVDNEPNKMVFEAKGNDSTEYDIIIIDPGFDQWFATHRKPEWYYGQSYLETWNRQYVSAWNEKVLNRQLQERYPRNPFMELIDYRAHIDYGLSLNYKLYHYFKFIEDSWGPILPSGSRII